MFYVPNFKLNLIFVSHSTKALNCSVTFLLPLYCVFEDLKIGKTIARGLEDWGLDLIDGCLFVAS